MSANYNAGTPATYNTTNAASYNAGVAVYNSPSGGGTNTTYYGSIQESITNYVNGNSSQEWYVFGYIAGGGTCPESQPGTFSSWEGNVTFGLSFPGQSPWGGESGSGDEVYYTYYQIDCVTSGGTPGTATGNYEGNTVATYNEGSPATYNEPTIAGYNAPTPTPTPTPGNAIYTPGNIATYNPTNISAYNPRNISGYNEATISGYTLTGTATYNTGDVANYVGNVANYNTGDPGSYSGNTLAGYSAGGGNPATYNTGNPGNYNTTFIDGYTGNTPVSSGSTISGYNAGTANYNSGFANYNAGSAATYTGNTISGSGSNIASYNAGSPATYNDTTIAGYNAPVSPSIPPGPVSYSGTVSISNNPAINFSLNGVGGTATATYRLGSNGQARRSNSGGTLIDISGEWLVSGTASDFEVRGVWSAGEEEGGIGNVGGATPNTWLNLGTTRDFTLTATNTFASRTLTIEIRHAISQVVLDTATISFSVDSAI